MKQNISILIMFTCFAMLKANAQVIAEGYFGKPSTLFCKLKVKEQIDSVYFEGDSKKKIASKHHYNTKGQLTYTSDYLWITGEKTHQEEYLYDKQFNLIQTTATTYPTHPDYHTWSGIYDEMYNFIRLHKLTPEKNILFKTKYYRYENGGASARRYYFDDTFYDTLSINYFIEDTEFLINMNGGIDVQYDNALFKQDSSVDKNGNLIICFTHKICKTQSFLKYHWVNSGTKRGLLQEKFRDDELGHYSTQFNYDYSNRRLKSIVVFNSSYDSNPTHSQHVQYYGSRYHPGTRFVKSIINMDDQERTSTVFYEYYPNGQTSKETCYNLTEKNWVLYTEVFYTENGLVSKVIRHEEKATHNYYYQYFD